MQSEYKSSQNNYQLGKNKMFIWQTFGTMHTSCYEKNQSERRKKKSEDKKCELESMSCDLFVSYFKFAL